MRETWREPWVRIKKGIMRMQRMQRMVRQANEQMGKREGIGLHHSIACFIRDKRRNVRLIKGLSDPSQAFDCRGGRQEKEWQKGHERKRELLHPKVFLEVDRRRGGEPGGNKNMKNNGSQICFDERHEWGRKKGSFISWIGMILSCLTYCSSSLYFFYVSWTVQVEREKREQVSLSLSSLSLVVPRVQ